jgi:hypothetical protein
MTLESINTRLTSEGYTVFMSRETLHIGKNGQEDPSMEDAVIFESKCTVHLEDQQLVLDYGQAAMPEEERFSTIGDLVQFIKQVFPL